MDEVHLLEMDDDKKKGKFLETCYRQQPGETGWCRTSGNFYSFADSSQTEIVETRIVELGFSRHSDTSGYSYLLS